MKKSLLSLILSVACLVPSVQAAISVDADGVGPFDFPARPTVAEGWSTLGVGTAANAYNNAAALDEAVIANTDATAVTTELGSSATAPVPSANAIARWNSTLLLVQSRPTENAYNILMATLQNDTGIDVTTLNITYDWGQKNTSTPTEQIPGHRVFYSTTGTPGSWVLIPELSSFDNSATDQNVVANVALASPWSLGTALYIIWVDDNADGGTEGAYTIDNISFTPVTGPLPFVCTLTAPADGLQVVIPTDITATANVSGGSSPVQSVVFFVNDIPVGSDTEAPYSFTFTADIAGTYTVYARALNSFDPDATSATHTVIARNEFVDYSGGTYVQDFDGMGATGTTTPTPIGWYVGWAPPATAMTATVGDGSAGAAANAAWNYGTVDAPDRALGLAPTGTGAPAGERNIIARIRNTSTETLASFTLLYDGEVWRNYTNLFGALTNYVSYDLGTTWIPTTFDFAQPFEPLVPQGAVDGNAEGNRTPGIGGLITCPVPVGPGGVIYIRWYDFNDGGTDGGLAIDNVSFTANFVQFQPFAILSTPTNGATFAAASSITIGAVATMNNPVASMEFFVDNVSIGVDTTAPFTAVYNNAVVGTHTLTATATDTASATVTTTNVVQIQVNPNVPPSITITNPVSGAEFLVGTMATNVSAQATDTDGTIVHVEFYIDGRLINFDTTVTYGRDLCDLTAGNHVITAVALDNAGDRATNSISISVTNPPDIQVILPNGSDWKYLVDGTNPGDDPFTTWATLGFDDSGWSNGIAELGYGDATGRPETTIVSTNLHPAAYFRKVFTVSNPSSYTNLILNVLKDDHCIVYLNGTVIFSDITNEVVNYQTITGAAIGHDGVDYETTNAPVSLLVNGQNILAVEVHQNSATSSDLSFDAMLWGQGAAGSKLNVAFDPGTRNLTVSWEGPGTLQSATSVTGPWTDVESATNPYTTTVPTTGGQLFYSLRP